MFSSQISTKDLFSTNPGQLMNSCSRSDNDSAFNSSQSQLMLYSQTQDFSQSQHFDSQDFSGNSNSYNESPAKSYLQRYMSKPLVFSNNKEPHASHKNNVSATHSNTKLTYQQVKQANKDRAREMDEKDILDSIFLTVKKCTQQVSGAVESIKESIDTKIEDKDKTFDAYLKDIQCDVRKHLEEVKSALSSRDEDRMKMKEMEKELAAKEAAIKSLEGQLEGEKDTRVDEVVRQLKDVYDKQHKENTSKLQELHDDHIELGTLQKNIESQQKNAFEELTKLIETIKDGYEHSIDKMLNKQKSELAKNQDMLTQQLGDYSKQHKGMLQTYTEKTMKEMEISVTNLIQEIKPGTVVTSAASLDHTYGQGASYISEKCRQAMKEICLQQQTDLETFFSEQVKQLSQQHTLVQQTALQSIQCFNHGEMQELSKQIMQKIQDTQNSLEKNIKQKHDEGQLKHTRPSTAQDQLHVPMEERPNDFSDDIQIIPNEIILTDTSIHHQRIGEVYNTLQKPVHHQGAKTCERPSKQHIWKFDPNFKSPARNWTTRSLFCRATPSPVATVIPQVQSKLQMPERISNSSTSSNNTSNSTTTCATVAQSGDKASTEMETPHRRVYRTRVYRTRSVGRAESQTRGIALFIEDIQPSPKSRKRAKSTPGPTNKKRKKAKSANKKGDRPVSKKPAKAVTSQHTMEDSDIFLVNEDMSANGEQHMPLKDSEKLGETTPDVTLVNPNCGMSTGLIATRRSSLAMQRSNSVTDLTRKTAGLQSFRKHSSFDIGSPETRPTLQESGADSQDSSPALTLEELMLNRRVKLLNTNKVTLFPK